MNKDGDENIGLFNAYNSNRVPRNKTRRLRLKYQTQTDVRNHMSNITCTVNP